jgi:septal ring-binding cell division protein DamX
MARKRRTEVQPGSGNVFADLGYRDVRVEPYTITGNPYYGVYVGKYFNKNDAKATAA